jgi:hypothetical protein
MPENRFLSVKPGAAPGRAVADLDRFEDSDVDAALGKVQRRRAAGVAGADNRDVRDGVAGQRLCRRRRRCSPLP